MKQIVSRRVVLAGFGGAALAACRAVAPTQTGDRQPAASAAAATGAPDAATGAGTMVAATAVAGPATGATVIAAPAVAGTSTSAPTIAAPTPTVEEKSLRLVLGERSWMAGVRNGTVLGLDGLLAGIGGEVARPARDAHLRILSDGRLEFTPSAPGLGLDKVASADQMRRAAAEGKAEAALLTRTVAPALDDGQFAAARELLTKLLEREGTVLTVRGGERTWTLDRAETAELLAFDFPKQPGKPVKLIVDEWPARAFARRLATALDRAPSAARFDWNNGKPKVLREAASGRTLDQDGTLKAFERTLLTAGTVVDLPLKGLPPAVTAEDAPAFAGAKLIESGSTALSGAIPEKRANVRLATERLNGTVVPPGATFSFNREVGPTTIESGFKWGFGITSGTEGIKTVPSVAGGICQVATTLFQPVFWAGYPLEERYWHLYWIPSYASRGVIGLDVTVDEDARLDFKWINPTRNPVLIQAIADDEKIAFQLYGTKPDWTVAVEPALLTNRVPPDTTPVIQEEPTLPWGRSIVVEAAREGFDAEVVRRVTAPDAPEPRVLTLKSSYQPSRTVTLIGTAGKPAAAAGAAAPIAIPAANRPAGASAPPPGEATPAPAAPTPAATPSAVGAPTPPALPPASVPPTPTPARPVAPALVKPIATPRR